MVPVVLAGRGLDPPRQRLIRSDDFRAVIQACRRRSLRTTAYACGSQFDFIPRESVYSEAAESPATDFNGMEIRHVPDLTTVDDDFVAVLVGCPGGMPVRRALLAELQDELSGRVRVARRPGGRYVEDLPPSFGHQAERDGGTRQDAAPRSSMKS